MRTWPIKIASLLVLPFLPGALLASAPARPNFPRLDHRGHVNKAVEDRSDPVWERAARESLQKEPISLRNEARGYPLIEGNPRDKCIALTFDDGPHPAFTEKLLAILRDEHVPATFFVVGKMAEKSPEIVRDEFLQGDLIGNHTFSHVTLTHLPQAQIRTELRACSDVIHDITGQWPHYCRPPGGDTSEPVVTAARDLGMTTVLWSDDPGDYSNPGAAVIKRRILAKLHPGAIILLHDGIPETMEVLPQIIRYARERGYRFVTVNQLPVD